MLTKRRTELCEICNFDIGASNIAKHRLVCDGSGPERFVKAVPNLDGWFDCNQCFRQFKSAMARSKHNCTAKRIASNSLSDYPYTRVFKRICNSTHRLFWSTNSSAKYHPDTALALRTYRARAAFKFNVYEYPERFNLDLLKEFGWYSPGGRHGRNTNLNLGGVSRDHLYPVKLGWENNVDPEILSHPANCELILHSENIRKRDKPALTLDELLRRIKDW